MSDYITLLGAEDVQRASRNIAEAADSLRHSANRFEEIIRQALDRAEDLALRMEQLAAKDPTP